MKDLARMIDKRDVMAINELDTIVKDAYDFFDEIYGQDITPLKSGGVRGTQPANASDYGNLMVEIAEYLKEAGQKALQSGQIKSRRIRDIISEEFEMMRLLALREAFNNYTLPYVQREKEAKAIVESNPALQRFRSIKGFYFALCVKYDP
jgi:hypothetical protein